MATSDKNNRDEIKKLSLADKGGLGPVGTDPAERLMMMWQIAPDCWAFVSGCDA